MSMLQRSEVSAWSAVSLGCFIILVLCFIARYQKSTKHHLPPSPPGDPIIGHIRHLPLNHSWETFWKWKKALGNIYHLNAFGRLIFVVSSPKIAHELFDTRGANTSDRVYSQTMNNFFFATFTGMGLDSTLPFLPYNDRWRRQRRIMQHYFNPQAIETYRPVQEQQVRIFLKELLSAPDHFVTSLRRLVSMSALKAAYGDSVLDYKQDLLEKFERAAHAISEVGDSGGTIIDLIPVLRFVPVWFPSWFPGVPVRRHAAMVRKMNREITNTPVEEIKARRAEGKVEPCFVSSMLEVYEKLQTPDSEMEEDIKAIGMVTFTAAYDTTYSSLLSFFLNMVLHPDVMRAAQAEIDGLTHAERLPTIDDRPRLPYIDSIVKEVYRFHPSGPIGAPHATTKDEKFDGWTIPAGSIIIGNIWAMMKDEQNFPNPQSFSPERHLKTSEHNGSRNEHIKADNETGAYVDPSEIVFGFGRRICPGRYFADAIIWLTIANVLAVFDIRPYFDPERKTEILPEVAFISGFTSSPKPFKCTIRRRGEKHALLTSAGSVQTSGE